MAIDKARVLNKGLLQGLRDVLLNGHWNKQKSTTKAHVFTASLYGTEWEVGTMDVMCHAACLNFTKAVCKAFLHAALPSTHWRACKEINKIANKKLLFFISQRSFSLAYLWDTTNQYSNKERMYIWFLWINIWHSYRVLFFAWRGDFTFIYIRLSVIITFYTTYPCYPP